ncbi:Tim44/TimA family putative adaptor protein [Dankookia sp. P2]|uniref:Tim44/TimA family putative adaptor protein n=1 Tax=Dankookia sp. P2 TaxID=3423955 RepID=UPI003D6717D1
MTGGFPLDLILFAMVAAFLVLRLRSVLGRRTGFERPPAPEPRAPGYDPRATPTLDGVAEEVRPAAPKTGTRHILPDPRTAPGAALGRIAAAERGFDPGTFLNGAEGAFRMIVAAFAAGDRRDPARPAVGRDLCRLRAGDHRAREGRRAAADRDPRGA